MLTAYSTVPIPTVPPSSHPVASTLSSMDVRTRRSEWPRDGLMTGIARRGHSLRLVRTCIELSVLATGWLLGGTVGSGTVLYAISIGPVVHLLLPRLTIRPGTPRLSSSGARDADPLPVGGRG